MTNFNTFLAMDFGAESGRAELITLKGRKITMKEIHRFPNRPVRLAGTLYWDLPSLYAEILTSLKICAEHKVKLAGMGIDTWGVDFGLLDKRGKLLSNPVHYRDQRTNNIHRYSGKIMSNDEIFAETGCEPWAIS